MLLGECAEAAVLLRDDACRADPQLGADDASTLTTESNLANVMFRLGEYTGADALYRAALKKMWRILR